MQKQRTKTGQYIQKNIWFLNAKGKDFNIFQHAHFWNIVNKNNAKKFKHFNALFCFPENLEHKSKFVFLIVLKILVLQDGL